MSYNNIQVGKIRNINYKTGVGEITTSDNNFLFTIEDLSTADIINEGDLVRFRAEIVNDTPKAYFVSRILPEELKSDYRVLESKTYRM